MSEINFVTIDSEQILNDLITQFEVSYRITLQPGDERHTFLLQMLPVIIGMKNSINDTGRQNLLRYARGEILDAMGDYFGVTRLPAQKALVTLQFSLSTAQALPVLIPAGTRATPDGSLYYATKVNLIIPAGQTTGSVTAESTEIGIKYNGYAAGQIKNIVDPIAYVASVVNTDTSAGGSDVESDPDYRNRIHNAHASYSVAGPEGAYIFWALSADNNIIDVSVSSPSAGVVKVVPLLINGAIPTQPILDRVLAAVSARDRRPLTDNVEVVAPTQVVYNIDLTYYISALKQTEEAEIRGAIEDLGGAVDQYKVWQSEKLGLSINPDQLRLLILQAGASRITLASPVYATLDPDQVAAIGTVNIVYGGLE